MNPPAVRPVLFNFAGSAAIGCAGMRAAQEVECKARENPGDDHAPYGVYPIVPARLACADLIGKEYNAEEHAHREERCDEARGVFAGPWRGVLTSLDVEAYMFGRVPVKASTARRSHSSTWESEISSPHCRHYA